MIEFRKLKASEIETRAQQVKQNGAIFLLYKDARADMKILDETVNPENWERNHKVVNGNLFCTVRIYDKDKKEWISKEDVGTESYTEKEKGQASDSFKRACVNWGIGRELYTSPFIWVNLSSDEVYKVKDKYRIKSKVKFNVNKIEYNDDGEISDLEIIDQDGNLRYKKDKYIAAGGKSKSTSNNSSSSSKQTKTATKKQVASLRDWTDNEKAKQIIIDCLKNNGYHSGKDIAKLTEEQADSLLSQIKKEVD